MSEVQHDPIKPCRCDDCEGFYRSRNVPDWLRMGAKARLPGGPVWVVKNITFFSHAGDEVQLLPSDDLAGPGVTWKLRDFLAVWEPEEGSSFKFHHGAS